MSVNSRTCKGSDCPVCAHSIPHKGVNDFESLFPDLMKEWDYKKNDIKGLIPSELLPNSEKKAWWICKECSNSWETAICNRTKGNGCPVCAINRHKRAVQNIDTGLIFKSVNEAGAYYGKPKNHHINECCQGKRRTALGYRWKYIDKD